MDQQREAAAIPSSQPVNPEDSLSLQDHLATLPIDKLYPILSTKSFKEILELKAEIFRNPKISPYLFHLFCHPNDPIWFDYIYKHLTREVPRLQPDETAFDFIERVAGYVLVSRGVTGTKFGAGGAHRTSHSYHEYNPSNASLQTCLQLHLEIPFQAKLDRRKTENPAWLVDELNEGDVLPSWLAIPPVFYQKIKSYLFKDGRITAEMLVLLAANAEKKKKLLEPFLFIAARAGQFEDMELLYNCFTEEEKEEINYRLFLACAAGGLVAVAEKLVAAKPEFIRVHYKETKLCALHIAALNGQSKFVEFFLGELRKSEFRIQFKVILSEFKGKETALALACKGGYAQVAQQLLQFNPEITAKYNWLWGNYFFLAVRSGNSDLVSTLLQALKDTTPAERKALFHQMDEFHRTPLHVAVSQHKTAVAAVLLNEADLDPNVGERLKDKTSVDARRQEQILYYEPPFYTALKHGDRPMVQLFMINPRQRFDVVTSHGETLLHAALRGRMDEFLPTLLDKGLKVSDVDDDGKHGLHVAAQYASLGAFKLLLQQPDAEKLLNQANQKNATPFFTTCAHGQYLIADYLLKRAELGFDPNQKNSEEYTALGAAFTNKKWYMVKRLLQDPRVSIHDLDKEKNSLLHLILLESRNEKADQRVLLEIYQLLIKRADFNLNVANVSGTSSVHFCAAATPAILLMQQFLTLPGIDYACQDSAGDTPLHLALRKKNFSWLEHLRALALDPKTSFGINSRNKEGCTPLAELIAHYNTYQQKDPDISLLTTLFDWGADANIADKDNKTLLYQLIRRCWGTYAESILAAIRLFLERGADPNHADKKGETPFTLVLNSSLYNIRAVLPLFVADERTDLTARTKEKNRTLLHIMLDDYSLDIDLLTKALKHPTCDPNLEDADGNTPLFYALRRENPSAVKALLANNAKPNYRSSTQDCALHVLAKGFRDHADRSLECATALLEQDGLDLNAQNADQQTALHVLATRANASQLTRKLASQPEIKFDVRDKDGQTAAHLAVGKDNVSWFYAVEWKDNQTPLREKNISGITPLQMMIYHFQEGSDQPLPREGESPKLRWFQLLVRCPDEATWKEATTVDERLNLIKELLTYAAVIPAYKKIDLWLLVATLLKSLPTTTPLSDDVFNLFEKNFSQDNSWWGDTLVNFPLTTNQKKKLIPLFAKYSRNKGEIDKLFLMYAQDVDLFEVVVEARKEDVFFLIELCKLSLTPEKKKLLIPILIARQLSGQLEPFLDDPECKVIILANVEAVKLLAKFAYTTDKKKVLIPALIQHNLVEPLWLFAFDKKMPKAEVKLAFDYFADLQHGEVNEKIETKFQRLNQLKVCGATYTSDQVTSLARQLVNRVQRPDQLIEPHVTLLELFDTESRKTFWNEVKVEVRKKVELKEGIYKDHDVTAVLSKLPLPSEERRALLPEAIERNQSVVVATLITDRILLPTEEQLAFDYFIDLTHGLDKETLSAKLARLIDLKTRGANFKSIHLEPFAKQFVEQLSECNPFAEIGQPKQVLLFALIDQIKQLLTAEDLKTFSRAVWTVVREKNESKNFYDKLLVTLLPEMNLTVTTELLVYLQSKNYLLTLNRIIAMTSFSSLYPDSKNWPAQLEALFPIFARRGGAIGYSLQKNTHTTYHHWPATTFSDCILAATRDYYFNWITQNTPGCEGAILTAEALQAYLTRENPSAVQLQDMSYYLMRALEGQAVDEERKRELKAMALCLFAHRFKTQGIQQSWPENWRGLQTELEACKRSLPEQKWRSALIIENALQSIIPMAGKPLQPAQLTDLKMMALFCQAQDWPFTTKERVLMVIGIVTVALLAAAAVTSALFFTLGIGSVFFIACAAAAPTAALVSGTLSGVGLYQFFNHRGTSATTLNHTKQKIDQLLHPVAPSKV